jgi:ArsR family transcriptional regulator, arsenate/arsenite/antimonite-responsive transcriptional repressor
LARLAPSSNLVNIFAFYHPASKIANVEKSEYSAPVKRLPTIQCCTPLAGTSLEDDDAVELERLFRALADRHRVKILNILMRAKGEAVCVCEFMDHLGLAQPTVSYHLKQLREAGLIDREKRGTFAYFRVRPEAMDRLHSLVEPATLARAS